MVVIDPLAIRRWPSQSLRPFGLEAIIDHNSPTGTNAWWPSRDLESVAIRRDSVSLLRFPFRRHVQFFSIASLSHEISRQLFFCPFFFF